MKRLIILFIPLLLNCLTFQDKMKRELSKIAEPEVILMGQVIPIYLKFKDTDNEFYYFLFYNKIHVYEFTGYIEFIYLDKRNYVTIEHLSKNQKTYIIEVDWCNMYKKFYRDGKLLFNIIYVPEGSILKVGEI